MSKIPSKVRICGRDYTIELRKDADMGGDNIGLIQAHVQRITIAQDQHEESQRETLLHEIIHACDWVGKLELSEAQTTALSRILFGVLVDNPEVAKWMLEPDFVSDQVIDCANRDMIQKLSEAFHAALRESGLQPPVESP